VSGQGDRGDRAGPVVVRSVLDPPGQWSAQQAIELLVQGYSIERVVAVTGFDVRWVRFTAGRRAGCGAYVPGSARPGNVGQ